MAEAYGKWLNSLVEPTAITVRSEPVDLAERADAIEHAARGLPTPGACGAARTPTHSFSRELASKGEGLRRRQILLVLSSRSRERDTARADLERRAQRDERAAARSRRRAAARSTGSRPPRCLLSALEPPGPPAGSHLDGVIHRC